MKRKPEPEIAITEPAPALIGYARVSTVDQNLDMQIEALEARGCLNIYKEKKSGADARRPELDLAIMDLRPGDTFLVWRLDRLARTIRELHRRLDAIYAQGAIFKSCMEEFDFNTPMGKFMLNNLGAFAQLERDLTIERTRAGMATRRRQGVRMGRERKIDDKLRPKIEKDALDGMEWSDIAKKYGVATSTLTLNFPGGKRKIFADYRAAKIAARTVKQSKR